MSALRTTAALVVVGLQLGGCCCDLLLYVPVDEVAAAPDRGRLVRPAVATGRAAHSTVQVPTPGTSNVPAAGSNQPDTNASSAPNAMSKRSASKR